MTLLSAQTFRINPFANLSGIHLLNLKQGDSVLVAAHGNSLRSIVMYLDNLSSKEVPKLELKTGVPIVYEIDREGKVTDKVILDD